MTIQLFNEEEYVALKEYSADSNYEDYAGIVLDKDKNLFKVITGKFTDKKDFYEKMAGRGLILRKCFEIRVYNWIKDNAKTTLDAYLMLSTAFSKWKGNNMLSGYYNKLLKDIPELNREGQKGNPNTRGKEESLLSEKLSKDPELNIQDLTSEEIDKIFSTAPSAGIYLPAIKEKDPILSANSFITLFNQYNFNKDEELSKISMSPWKDRNYELKKHYQNALNPDKKINSEVLRQQNTDLRNDYNETTYTINIRPVVCENREEDIHTEHEEQGTIKASISYPVRVVDGYSLTEKGIALPKLLTGTSIRKKLESGVLADLFYKLYRTYEADNGYPPQGYALRIYTDNASQTDITSYFGEFDYHKNAKVFNITTKKSINTNNDGIKPELKGALFVSGRTARSLIDTAKSKMASVKNNKTHAHLRYGVLSQNLSFMQDEDKNAQREIVALLAEITRQINAHEKKYLEDPSSVPSNIALHMDNYRKQLAILTDKVVAINNSRNRDNIVKLNHAIDIINNDAKKLIYEDYYNYLLDNLDSEAVNTLKGIDARAERDEIIDKANYAGISKEDQGATLHDKVLRAEELQSNKKHLHFNNEGILTDKDAKPEPKPKSKPKSDPKKEKDKESKLVNQIRLNTNRVKRWDYLFKASNEKDKEAKKQLDKAREALDSALANHKEYQKKNSVSTADNLNVEESAVNDGATAYYTDQQAAANDALKGTIVTEELTHSELNPELFDGETLKPEILDAFLSIADKFKQSLSIRINPVDVYFTGSNANYNYNENSDIDIHLVYDFEQVGIAADILEKYLKDAKRLFNLDYSEIKIKGIKVEIGYENLATPLVATAVYSLRYNNWVKKPEMKATEVEDPDTNQYTDITSRIETAIQDKDYDTLKDLWEEISELRKNSLNLEGEFGKGNLLFKKLRNLGALGRLRDAYYKAASKELSLESNGESTNE